LASSSSPFFLLLLSPLNSSTDRWWYLWGMSWMKVGSLWLDLNELTLN
jgi:hypothetical protein